MSGEPGLAVLPDRIESCRRCPRLVEYRERVASEKRRAFRDEIYWGRPVAGFGDLAAKIWVLGLAPAAHGANRTGRVFTGDRSGDFLFAGLYRSGLANQSTSVSRDDGLLLSNCFVSAAVRCAPPDNKPLPDETLNCSEYLDCEWALLRGKRVILALGKFAWDAALSLARRNGAVMPLPRPAFGHGAEAALGYLRLIGSYHVSQQNTFTGRLTTTMFDTVLRRAIDVAADG